MLEDHADAAADTVEIFIFHDGHLAVRRHFGELFAADGDAARIGKLQKIDASNQRGFPRARIANDAVDLAFMNGEIHVLDRVHVTTLEVISLIQMLNFDHGVHVFIFSLWISAFSQKKRRAETLRVKTT